MRREPKSRRAYQALIHLYPKAHRQEYGELMVQTFDDLLHEDSSTRHTITIWLRVASELPANITQEHIHNLEGKKMSDFKPNRRAVMVVSAIAVVVAAAVFGLTTYPREPFTATTLAHIQSPAKKPACLQKTKNDSLRVSDKDKDFVAQAAAGSILDVPAGTTVDAYLKTYAETKATGTAVYGGKYGTYNFVAERTKSDPTNPYTAGWQITQFEACKN